MPGTSPGMTRFSLALELPVDAVPVQRGDDARPDPVAHAVRSRAPRHHRSSPGRAGSSGSGARGPSGVPLHAGRLGPGPRGACPSRPCSSRIGSSRSCRLRLDRLSLGLDGRRPLDIFRCFRSLRASRIRDPSVALAGALALVVSPPPSDKLRSPACAAAEAKTNPAIRMNLRMFVSPLEVWVETMRGGPS